MSDVESPMQAIGVPPELEFVSVTFLALLTLASGVGMWRGAQWGWWCSAFYFMYGVFRNASAALMFLAYAEQVDGPRDPELAVLKHCFRVLLHSLVFSYFMRPHVLAFFDLQELNKRAAFWKIVGLCLTISAGAYLAAKLPG
ncbi:MAG: hypothetical protein SGJ19_09785 [Planctomycetia bacterium]|nr:hypothetical protein [Planctomycetia bacterium]